MNLFVPRFPVYKTDVPAPEGFQIRSEGIRYDRVYDNEDLAHDAAVNMSLRDYEVVPALGDQ